MTIPNFSLEGKVAIVTGSRRGIGRAIALAFAEAGADVAVCSRTIEDGELQGVAEEIKRLGGRSLALQTDIARKAEVDKLVQRVMDEFGVIDILVNNAAVDVRKPILELTEDEWDKVININLKGYYLCSLAVARRMIERRKGNIISMASQLAFKAQARMGVYCISKAGVVMLTRVLARELGSYGIRANAIAPSLVRAELGRLTWSDPEALKRVESAIPLGGRMAEPGDIVGTALFLASDASSYISGHTILVDAGTNA
jgi:NAD(P)-dependent dehydrogenase (short-subunit alcohol dehydrogenase family)